MRREGTFVELNAWVQRVAHAMLGESEAIQWHCPNVFSIRYGSSYVATATAGVLAIRFHSNEGDFQEGDDKQFLAKFPVSSIFARDWEFF